MGRGTWRRIQQRRNPNGAWTYGYISSGGTSLTPLARSQEHPRRVRAKMVGDSGNTNFFAFNYGNGAGGWIYTKPIKLAAEQSFGPYGSSDWAKTRRLPPAPPREWHTVLPSGGCVSHAIGVGDCFERHRHGIGGGAFLKSEACRAAGEGHFIVAVEPRRLC